VNKDKGSDHNNESRESQRDIGVNANKLVNEVSKRRDSMNRKLKLQQ
jgi:hypothetical protein